MLPETRWSRPDAYYSNMLENLSDSSKDSQDFPWTSDQNSSKEVVGVFTAIPARPSFGVHKSLFSQSCSSPFLLPLLN